MAFLGPSIRRIPSNDAVDVALHHLGGTGPDLLICHATGFHGRAYGPLGRALADDFSVWALDFRGHGASTPPRSGDFNWEGMANDVMACVGAIGADHLVAVGHSLGGAAILLTELTRPGTFDAAYLYEPIVFPADFLVGRTDNPMSGPARKRRAAFPDRRAAYERYRGRPPLDALHPEALTAYVEHGFVDAADGTVRLACEPEHEARTFEAEDKMTLDLLVGLDLRLTIGVGQPEASFSPARLAPAVAATVPGARLIEYDLGHFGPLEDPELIAADIRRALGADDAADDGRTTGP